MRKPVTYTYSSVFADEITAFLQLRVEKDQLQKGDRYILKCLDDHLIQENVTTKVLERDVIDAWLNSLEGASKKSRYTSVYRLFSNYLRGLGHKTYQPSPLRATPDPSPRIFSHEEMGRLFHASDNLLVLNDYVNVQLWFPVVIRLIYGCGLRVGEAVGLLNKDIDWTNGTLMIRSGITHKNRLIPMSDSLTAVCREYYEVAHPTPSPDAPFFYNHKGKALTNAAPYFWLEKVLGAAGIADSEDENKTKNITLTTLRHTFAVHSLQRLAEQGVDPAAFLPILSTYLGHADINEIEFYLKLIPLVNPVVH